MLDSLVRFFVSGPSPLALGVGRWSGSPPERGGARERLPAGGEVGPDDGAGDLFRYLARRELSAGVGFGPRGSLLEICCPPPRGRWALGVGRWSGSPRGRGGRWPDGSGRNAGTDGDDQSGYLFRVIRPRRAQRRCPFGRPALRSQDIAPAMRRWALGVGQGHPRSLWRWALGVGSRD